MFEFVMFEFVMFLLFAVGVIAFITVVIVNMLGAFVDIYIARHINEKHHSGFGSWLFERVSPEYLETVFKKDEAC